MVRPKKQIDKRQFESLCGIQATKEEICAVLFVTDKTLDRWCKETYNESFSEIFKQKRAIGKASLRRMQWKLAEKNATMSIFLGKQYLGQSDKIETENTNTNKNIDLSGISDEQLETILKNE